MSNWLPLLFMVSFILCVLGTLTESIDPSNTLSDKDSVSASKRLKRSLYLFPYRQQQYSYLADDADADENSFDRKRRIPYYYPQRNYQFAAYNNDDESLERKRRAVYSYPFQNWMRYNYAANEDDGDTEDTGLARRKRVPYYYPQQSFSFPVYDEDSESPDEMERKRRAVMSYPAGNGFNYHYFLPSEDEATDENVFKRRRRVVPYYFPNFGANTYNRYFKRFNYFGNGWKGKRKRSTADERKRNDDSIVEEEEKRRETSEIKRGLLLDDLANDDPTSFGYDKRKREE